MVLGASNCSFFLVLPFLNTATVNYIQTGENVLDDYNNIFKDFQNTNGVKWLR